MHPETFPHIRCAAIEPWSTVGTWPLCASRDLITSGYAQATESNKTLYSTPLQGSSTRAMVGWHLLQHCLWKHCVGGEELGRKEWRCYQSEISCYQCSGFIGKYSPGIYSRLWRMLRKVWVEAPSLIGQKIVKMDQSRDGCDLTPQAPLAPPKIPNIFPNKCIPLAHSIPYRYHIWYSNVTMHVVVMLPYMVQ